MLGSLFKEIYLRVQLGKSLTNELVLCINQEKFSLEVVDGLSRHLSASSSFCTLYPVSLRAS